MSYDFSLAGGINCEPAHSTPTLSRKEGGGGIDGYLSLPEGPRLIFGNFTRYIRISHEMESQDLPSPRA